MRTYVTRNFDVGPTDEYVVEHPEEKAAIADHNALVRDVREVLRLQRSIHKRMTAGGGIQIDYGHARRKTSDG